MRTYAIMAILALLVACSQTQPELIPSDIIAQEKFTQVMVDVQLIEGMKIHKLGPQRSKSPDMEAMYSELFRIHNVDSEKFYKTYEYFKQRPAKMEMIYEAVLDSLSKLDVEVKKNYNTPKNLTDTLNLDSIKRAAKENALRIQSEILIPSNTVTTKK